MPFQPLPRLLALSAIAATITACTSPGSAPSAATAPGVAFRMRGCPDGLASDPPGTHGVRRSILPPGGSGVWARTPAARKAASLTHQMWPHLRARATG